MRSIDAGGAWAGLPVLFIFVLLPIGDYILGVDLVNQPPSLQKKLQEASKFKWCTLSVIPCNIFTIGYGCWAATTRDVSWLEYAGYAWGVGVYSAVSITVGHELCHKVSLLERMGGRLLLCLVTYGHFYVEHTLGHHKWVATDQDPATARFGESFYAFLPRVLVGEFTSALALERDRLARKRLPWYHNEVPLYFAASAALCCAYAQSLGTLKAGGFFLAQSAVGVLLFESVNYLEHYGLERRRDAKTGAYEQVQPQHSWDSPARLTNMVLVKLQRHADHHAHAGKRFQTLQAYDTSPQLPSGYATMVVLALVPPLWRAVVDPRLMEFRRNQKGQVWRHGPTPK